MPERRCWRLQADPSSLRLTWDKLTWGTHRCKGALPPVCGPSWGLLFPTLLQTTASSWRVSHLPERGDLIVSKPPKSQRKSPSFLPKTSWDVKKNQDEGGAATMTSSQGAGVGVYWVEKWNCNVSEMFANTCLPLWPAVGSFSSNIKAQTHHHIQPDPIFSQGWQKSEGSVICFQKPTKTKFWLLSQRGSTLSPCWLLILRASLSQSFLHKIFMLSLHSLVSVY